MSAPRAAAAALALAVAVVAAHPAAAGARGQTPDTLREALIGRPSQDGRNHTHAPTVARYATADGVTFIVDRTATRILLKFERNQEIWALTPSPAPRGDVIYRNDLGQPVLRSTRMGGLTLFTPDNPMGVPAAVVGEAPPFRPPELTPHILLQHLARASAKASRAAGRLIAFNAPEVTPESAFVVADAAGVAAEALARLAATANGRAMVQKVRSVRIVVGRRAEANLLDDGVLEIVVAPRESLAGRPSSARIIRVVAER